MGERKPVTCPTCHGKGTTLQGDLLHGYKDKPCPNCGGRGIIE